MCYDITCISKHCRTEMENVAVFPVPDCDLRNRCLVNTMDVWTNNTGNFNIFHPPFFAIVHCKEVSFTNSVSDTA